ncbi:MAG: hypothetical protein IJ184_01725 [Alphaproteobacteria bacterium]|nr:hypothetical protein [Alphaproteobacteria bacterium]
MLEQLLANELVIKTQNRLREAFDGIMRQSPDWGDVKIIALLLIVSALTIFVLLIIVVLLRNIFRLFGRNRHSASTATVSDSNFSDLFSDEEQQELEREMQKELELALAQRAELEQRKEQEQRKQQQDDAQKRADEQQKEQAAKEKEENSSRRRKKVDIGLDWKNQKEYFDRPAADSGLDASMLSYQQRASSLNQLIGLLIDMIGRGVDDLKLAQTLNYKTKSMASENDILKLIDAVKYFIRLCQDEVFAKLDNYAELPSEAQALYHLANNDVSLSLVLMENLIDKMVDKTSSMSEDKRQQMFSRISDYSCCFGTLAEINDVMLATSVYEMAVELNSSNSLAWSRLGDVYRMAANDSKAIWAYENAYSFADAELNPADMANAADNMSDYLYAKGNSLQAAKMHNIAKQYYDSLGINNRFSKSEIDAISIIESNHRQNLPEVIKKLLEHTK